MPDLMDFQFVGGPIEQPRSANNAWVAIGHAAAAWARLEQHIDALLLQVNKEQHSKELFDPDHPVSFGRKLKLLKRWFNQHPPLAADADNIREMTSRLKVLARDRNLYLHSILESYDPAIESIGFRSLKWEGKGRFRVSFTKRTIREIADFAALVVLANKWLWEISSRLFTPDGVERLQRP